MKYTKQLLITSVFLLFSNLVSSQTKNENISQQTLEKSDSKIFLEYEKKQEDFKKKKELARKNAAIKKRYNPQSKNQIQYKLIEEKIKAMNQDLKNKGLLYE